MGRKKTEDTVLRKLYAESMGKCMNPDCKADLIFDKGDIIERAHIKPYCKTEDNSYENLILLCPSCHTRFDKISDFTEETVRSWKKTRKEEIDRFFRKHFTSFDELKAEVRPYLLSNKTIFEEYFWENEERTLWDKFEGKILINNRKIKLLLLSNLELIQRRKDDDDSNYEIVRRYIAHIDEFESTRNGESKNRQILFPEEINSIFGIKPIKGRLFTSVESIEAYIKAKIETGEFEKIELGIDEPYILLRSKGDLETVFLRDLPRINQEFYSSRSFRKTKVRLDSLNFALKYIRNNGIQYRFEKPDSLRSIKVKGKTIVFVYEYCLSRINIVELALSSGTIIVNLHNWNGEGCISKEAYSVAESMGIKLLTMERFYPFIRSLRVR